MINKIKIQIRKILNLFIKTESMVESKKKWNSYAKDNSSYYIMTDYGENITDEQFRESGKRDFEELINNDPLLVKVLSPFNTKNILEIGCGTGRITEFSSEKFKTVTGVDISEDMISRGQIRLKDKKNVILKATDGSSIPFQDNYFDLVFSFIVFQHMPDEETIQKNIMEISRVLKSGGIAKIQLRGIPTSKKNWFYGESFNVKGVNKMIEKTQLQLTKTEGENKKYFWVWLTKK